MTDEKSIVKMNKMIHKKTGASFLVVYVIYALCIQIARKRSFPLEKEAIKHDLVEFKVQCLKIFCYHDNKSTILLFIQFLEQLLKFLLNFTSLKYVKSQKRYGFLITKELIFGFQIWILKITFQPP